MYRGKCKTPQEITKIHKGNTKYKPTEKKNLENTKFIGKLLTSSGKIQKFTDRITIYITREHGEIL